MAQLGSTFDATTVAPDAGGFGEVLPKGWVLAQIDDSEMKPTSNGTGQRLNLRFSVIDGDYKNRKVFHGLNIQNQNPQAEQIARAELSAICHAISRMQITDSAELHSIPMWIKVGVEAGGPKPEGGTYPDRNKITSFKANSFVPPAGELMGAAGGSAQAPAAPFAGATAAAAPANPFGAPAAAPAAPAPAAPAVPAPPVPVHVQKAPAELLAEGGWTAHPQAPGYWYKGQDVKLEAEALQMLAPPAPAVPAAPAIPAAPAAPAVNTAPAVAAAATAAQGATPPWASAQ